MMQFLASAQMRHLAGAIREMGSASSTRFDSVLGMGVGSNIMHVACRASAVNYVECFDVSNPSNPSRTGSVTPNNQPDHSDQTGTTAVIVSNTETETINVSTRVSADTLAEGGSAVVASGNYAYVAENSANKLKVIDISTPTSISLTGSVTNANLSNTRGLIAYSAGYVFLLDDNQISCVDVSVPASPSYVGKLTFSTSLSEARSITISGNYAYCVGDSLTYAIDISTPSSMFEADSISDFSADGNARKFAAVIGNTLFLYRGLNIREINITDPTNMAYVAQTSVSANGGLQASGQFLYAVDETNEVIRVLL